MNEHRSTTAEAMEIVPGVLVQRRCGWYGKVMATAHRIEDHQVHLEFTEGGVEVYSEHELLLVELAPPEW